MPRQKALSRLLIIIQKLPEIYHSAHQDDPKAIKRILEWVSKNIDRFKNIRDPRVFLSLLDTYIAQLQAKKEIRREEAIAKYIKEYKQQNSTRTYPRTHPQCKWQCSAIRLLLQQPPQKISEITRELNGKNQTLYSHWKQKCQFLFREIGRKIIINYSIDESIDEKFRVSNNYPK